MEYINYFWNKYQTDNEQRIIVANIYHDLFIDDSYNLSSKTVIKNTIIHALEWVLQYTSEE